MRSLPIRLPAGLTCLLLASCGVTPSSPQAAGAESRVKMEQWLKPEQEGIEETDKLVNLGIPLVDFGLLPQPFGRAHWSAGARGQYECGYYKDVKIEGGECYGITIFGTPSTAPVLDQAPSVSEPGPNGTSQVSSRQWSTVQVPGLNRSIRYYFVTMAFGDTDNTWQTEPFTITGPDGKTGSYQATIECDSAKVAEAMFAKMRIK